MRLLIVTQKVDQNDKVLGFVHAWLKEFAKHFESLIVICLEEGSHSLPANVAIHSLGKEKSTRFKRFRYILRFIGLIVKMRNKYDAVFIHMNPIYGLLGGWLWKISRKPTGLWYIHPKADRLLSFVRPFIDFVATASLETFPLQWGKMVKAVGHGIDTEYYSGGGQVKDPQSILFVGRIAPIKRLEIIAEALLILEKRNIPFTFDAIGGPSSSNFAYLKSATSRLNELIDNGRVRFIGEQPSSSVAEAYRSHQILVSATPTGSFDKTVLEAMSCQMIPVTGNKAFKGAIPDKAFVDEDTSEGFAAALSFVLELSHEKLASYGVKARRYVELNHNLEILPQKLMTLYGEQRKR